MAGERRRRPVWQGGGSVERDSALHGRARIGIGQSGLRYRCDGRIVVARNAFADDRVVGFVNVPGISADCKIVRVSGDSMSPVINNGDYVALREVRDPSIIFGDRFTLFCSKITAW